MFNSKDYEAFCDKGLAKEFETIGSLNLFMQCDSPNKKAFSELPTEYNFRLCQPAELEIWKRIIVHEQYVDYVTEYYNKIYAKNEDEFFRHCWFVCNKDNIPVASCLLWQSYGLITTIGWYAVSPEHEGKGLGRALMSKILTNEKFPIYLHTQPTSARAIKLYSDFGFKLITDPIIGYRKNDVEQSLPYLQTILPKSDFENLQFTVANIELHKAALTSQTSEF